jgi:hypothetical protein
LSQAKLFGARYEPAIGKQPDVVAISDALGLETLTYKKPHSLVSLRKSFKESGYREQERQITYALKHPETYPMMGYPKIPESVAASLVEREPVKGDLLSSLDAGLKYILFELTTDWGLRPWRALVILLTLIPIFAIPYAFRLLIPGCDGIWRIWSDGRARKDLGGDKPELINAGFLGAIGFGLYFSLISAFHIGWRDFNVGSWISRLQPREYTLHASGWLRTVSGAQSLISVFLLAIWALTYFGRPFE